MPCLRRRYLGLGTVSQRGKSQVWRHKVNKIVSGGCDAAPLKTRRALFATHKPTELRKFRAKSSLGFNLVCTRIGHIVSRWNRDNSLTDELAIHFRRRGLGDSINMNRDSPVVQRLYRALRAQPY